MSAWLRSPRTLVMGLVLLGYAVAHARSFAYTLERCGHTAHLGETVFYYLNTGFNVVMTSTFLLIMLSEIPKRMAFQNVMLIRISRGTWLRSLLLFCVAAVLLMMGLMTALCVGFSLPSVTPGQGWSDLERLAANPDYQYEPQFVAPYIRVLQPWQACLCAAGVLFLFWLTMLLVILLFSLLGQPQLGLLVYMFILQFALIFRFEIVHWLTPIHFATLNNAALQFEGRELASLPRVFGAYLLIDGVLVALMRLSVQHADLRFSGKD